MISTGFPGARRRGRTVSLSLLFFLTSALPLGGQEAPNIQALESEYLAARAEYEAAFLALEALESRYSQALDEFDAARASDDETRANRAFTAVQQLGAERRAQDRRVEEKAQNLRDARSRLLEALGTRLEGLIQEVDAATDPEDRRQLALILADRNNRYLELRGEEDPETTLEPMPDLVISPSDSPRDILRKAGTLDFRAEQYQARLTDVERRLEELRRDQRRARAVQDFVAGLERYDDTRLPVVPPSTRAVDPSDPGQVPAGADTLGVEARPLTLEERIENLELLGREMEERLQQIRDKANRFRRLAGGGGR